MAVVAAREAAQKFGLRVHVDLSKDTERLIRLAQTTNLDCPESAAQPQEPITEEESATSEQPAITQAVEVADAAVEETSPEGKMQEGSKSYKEEINEDEAEKNLIKDFMDDPYMKRYDNDSYDAPFNARTGQEIDQSKEIDEAIKLSQKEAKSFQNMSMNGPSIKDTIDFDDRSADAQFKQDVSNFEMLDKKPKLDQKAAKPSQEFSLDLQSPVLVSNKVDDTTNSGPGSSESSSTSPGDAYGGARPKTKTMKTPSKSPSPLDKKDKEPKKEEAATKAQGISRSYSCELEKQYQIELSEIEEKVKTLLRRKETILKALSEMHALRKVGKLSLFE